MKPRLHEVRPWLEGQNSILQGMELPQQSQEINFALQLNTTLAFICLPRSFKFILSVRKLEMSLTRDQKQERLICIEGLLWKFWKAKEFVLYMQVCISTCIWTGDIGLCDFVKNSNF